jgi:hypothetical protein
VLIPQRGSIFSAVTYAICFCVRDDVPAAEMAYERSSAINRRKFAGSEIGTAEIQKSAVFLNMGGTNGGPVSSRFAILFLCARDIISPVAFSAWILASVLTAPGSAHFLSAHCPFCQGNSDRASAHFFGRDALGSVDLHG